MRHVWLSSQSGSKVIKAVTNHEKGLSGTKPRRLLRKHIPINTNQWDTTQVDFMETDTVTHCGTSLMSEFVWSIIF
ncbi:hypothetical protein Lsan_2560 [Legionella santicrucis]|uniref:Uncharacterized protein n=1 Tax=Legionella santicrucis TaxID=45074 RepID=A0A0W0YKR4_9GAMM|nr:hypothetical protein [Legionella santicrucis]KTD57458.1 hypothetical protein Lsan_2560 [Legionella santicrucis]